MLKGFIDKLLKSTQSSSKTENNPKPISHEEVEALIEAKIQEHATAQSTLPDSNQKKSADQEHYSLTSKQVDYALSLISKLNGEFVLAIDPSQLTLKDLNKLIGYNRYKNKGILVNLAKKGVLKRC